MQKILFTIVSLIYNILPDSPFRTMIDGVVYEVDFLPTLNWFLPFDVCSKITLVWLDCILAYYVFEMVRKIVMDYLINKIFTGVSILKGVK